MQFGFCQLTCEPSSMPWRPRPCGGPDARHARRDLADPSLARCWFAIVLVGFYLPVLALLVNVTARRFPAAAASGRQALPDPFSPVPTLGFFLNLGFQALLPVPGNFPTGLLRTRTLYCLPYLPCIFPETTPVLRLFHDWFPGPYHYRNPLV